MFEKFFVEMDPIVQWCIVVVTGSLIYLAIRLLFSSSTEVKSTLQSQAPTEEELLLEMSDTELLRELVRLQRMALQSQQSQTRVSRLGIFGFLALLSSGE